MQWSIVRFAGGLVFVRGKFAIDERRNNFFATMATLGYGSRLRLINNVE